MDPQTNRPTYDAPKRSTQLPAVTGDGQLSVCQHNSLTCKTDFSRIAFYWQLRMHHQPDGSTISVCCIALPLWLLLLNISKSKHFRCYMECGSSWFGFTWSDAFFAKICTRNNFHISALETLTFNLLTSNCSSCGSPLSKVWMLYDVPLSSYQLACATDGWTEEQECNM